MLTPGYHQFSVTIRVASLSLLILAGCSSSKSQASDATKAQLQASEAARKAAEAARVEADKKRVQAEEKLASMEGQLATCERRLTTAELHHSGTEEPKGADSKKWPQCKARRHTTSSKRTALAKLARRHKGLLGIDVSHYDGRPDWRAVAGSEIAFVMVKATQGTSFRDPCFERNMAGAQAENLLWSAYHVLDPDTDGTKQAEAFLKAVGVHKYTLPLVLDVEQHLVKNKPKSVIEGEIGKWLAHVQEQTGQRPMLYVGHNLVKSYLDKKWPLGDYPVWYADYNGKSKPDYFASMPDWIWWQFVDNGEIPGLRSAVDVSVFRGTREQLGALLTRP